MMERLVMVVNTGGNEGFSMVKGIRSAGVFCTQVDAEHMVVPKEAKGAVVIGESDEGALDCLRALLAAQLPILAFGAPAAQLAVALGGQVTGCAITNQLKDVQFANIGVCAGVEGGMRMLERAQYLSLPQGCRTLCGVEGTILGFDEGEGQYTGFQFLPEAHDVEASEIIGNFLWNVMGIKPNYSYESYIEDATRGIRDVVGDGQAVCVLSGGVDSAVAACLAKHALGERLHCLVIDSGLARDGDMEYIHDVLGGQLGLDIRRINAQGRMMESLTCCVTPAQKRECVSRFIGERIADEVTRLGGHVVVMLGTNYHDVLRGHVQCHLGGDIPVVEPLLPLFKDEVRAIATILGVPDVVATRQHYPSAGIALRCLGSVNADRLSALRKADELLRSTLNEAGQIKSNTQAFAVLCDVSGIFMDENPRYVVILRAVNSSGSDRSTVLRLPHDVLERASERIIGGVENVFRVVYDLTTVPPSLVEWE